MSKKLITSSLLAVVGLGLAGFRSSPAADQPWRLPLDLTGKEYRVLNAKLARNHSLLMSGFFDETTKTDQALQAILKVGARNLQWVDAINAARPKDKWILLTTPETQNAYPMDKPRVYNGEIVVKEYSEKVAGISKDVMNVLTAEGALPTNPPISDDEFTKAARAIDFSYQGASRWLMMKPYLGELAERRAEDIRGYYFLTQMSDLQQKLQGYAQLPADQQSQLRTYLLSMCYDVEVSDSACESKFDAAASSDLTAFFNQYKNATEEIYQGFYQIPSPSPRTDMTDTNVGGVETFAIPFTAPQTDRVLHFVKDNVEAEWTQNAQASKTPWALKLNMTSAQSDTIPHVEFQEGVTPHVNAIGGNIITMDQNVSLDDYGNNWTIRHEFGHVLGFPDCYLEFYDSNQKVIINYQLDITNLMCSRRGHIQDKHFQELKRAYGRNH